MNIDLAVVADQLENLQTGINNLITVFKTFPEVIDNFADALTSSSVLDDAGENADKGADAAANAADAA